LPKFPNILKNKRKIIPNNPGRDGGAWERDHKMWEKDREKSNEKKFF